MRCEHCDSDDKCTFEADRGFCNLYHLGQDAPCVADARRPALLWRNRNALLMFYFRTLMKNFRP